MEYFRKNFLRGSRDDRSPSEYNPDDRTIVIHPGGVEEVAHAVAIPGLISLEELRFWAYVPDPHEYNNIHNKIGYSDGNNLQQTDFMINALEQQEQHRRETDDSYLDIVVFEAPIHCSSVGSNGNAPCDLLSYGIGTLIEEHKQGEIPRSHVSLCNEATGRLAVNHTTFDGYHTVLHIPPSGYLMKDRITDPLAHKIPSFPSLEYRYEILIANCDVHAYGTGRNIELSGQVLFQLDDSIGGATIQQTSHYPPEATSNGNDYGDTPWRYHVGTRHQQIKYGPSIVLGAPSQIKLFGVGFFVCLFFSLASFRIHSGTRSDYFTARLNERRQRHQTEEEQQLEQQ